MQLLTKGYPLPFDPINIGASTPAGGCALKCIKTPLMPGKLKGTGDEWRDRVLAAGTSHDYGAPVF
jgi:hypothetical protein